MKIVVLVTLTAAVSSQVAADHGTQHEHAKKDVVTEFVTETNYVTETPTNPAVIVWVDNDGNVVSTETRKSIPTPEQESTPVVVATTAEASKVTQSNSQTSSTPALPVASSSTASVFVLPIPTNASPPHSSVSTSALSGTSMPLPAVSTQQGSEGGSARLGSSQTGGAMSGLGIAYDLIDDNGGCKSAGTVKNDFDIFGGAYKLVRIYSTDCNAVGLVTAEATKRNMKVIAGIGNNHVKTGLAANIALLVSQAGSNLGTIDTVAIGNEYVDSGAGPVEDIVSGIAIARLALSGIFSGRIVTVDTFAALVANPPLCSASDYCAANCHAYYTDTIPASGAGDYVAQMVTSVSKANPGKQVVITESGWPWKSTDASNTRATAANQAAAIASLKETFTGNLVLFQGFDTMYKQPGSDGTEQFFGIYDH